MNPPLLTADLVASWREDLAAGCEGDAAALIDLIAALEDLTSTARAVQAEAAVKYDAARRADEARAGVPARRQGRGVAGEIALARKESAKRGQSLLGLAKVLTGEMPHTLARLRDGSLNEFRATILARETGAEVARLLAARSLSTGVGAWFRQLYVNPLGRLVALTSRQRCFPDGLAELLEIQGQGICATPWCDAPVQHLDHITPHDDGGATDRHNGQGLCSACNHAKQAGWQQCVASALERPTVVTTTPTGHRYQATAPAPPGWRSPRLDIGWGECAA